MIFLLYYTLINNISQYLYLVFQHGRVLCKHCPFFTSHERLLLIYQSQQMLNTSCTSIDQIQTLSLNEILCLSLPTFMSIITLVYLPADFSDPFRQ